MGSSLDTIAPIALAVVGSLIGNPELGLLGGIGSGLGTAGGAALGAGLGGFGVDYSRTHNIGQSLLAGGEDAAGSYVGGQVAEALGPSLGMVGGDLGFGSPAVTDASTSNLGGWDSAMDSQIANVNPYSAASTTPMSAIGAGSGNIASSLGGSAGASGSGIFSDLGSAASSALNVPVTQALGSYAGNQYATGFNNPGQPSMKGQYPWIPASPGQPGGGAAGTMPTSLNQMSNLTPLQQATGLATQGVYGGGLGPQEQGYFGNLVQQQLVPSYGQTADLSTLAPIENTYLGNLGFGNEGSSYNLAKALSQWNPSA